MGGRRGEEEGGRDIGKVPRIIFCAYFSLPLICSDSVFLSLFYCDCKAFLSPPALSGVRCAKSVLLTIMIIPPTRRPLVLATRVE